MGRVCLGGVGSYKMGRLGLKFVPQKPKGLNFAEGLIQAFFKVVTPPPRGGGDPAGPPLCDFFG